MTESLIYAAVPVAFAVAYLCLSWLLTPCAPYLSSPDDTSRLPTPTRPVARMTRAQFDALSPAGKMRHVRDGGLVFDGAAFVSSGEFVAPSLPTGVSITAAIRAAEYAVEHLTRREARPRPNCRNCGAPPSRVAECAYCGTFHGE